jgi:epoxyqueuosine reductase
MKAQEITDRLQLALREHGFKSAIVSSDHVKELREKIKDDLRSGVIKDVIYQLNEKNFNNMLTQNVSWAKSIIVVAAPTPILDVVFTLDNKKHSIVIPPTYDRTVDDTLIALIDKELRPNGYQFCRAILPEKLLAAQAGLASYGKNNIAYVEGMGSFNRPIAFYTDIPTVYDTWREPEMLDECTGCNTCTKKCPTKAIDPDQFHIHAEKCLTYYNESSGDFPSWIDKSWHHCLIGCMKCQQNCPVNKDVRSYKKRFAELSEEESTFLLKGVAKNELPQSLIDKFEKTFLLDDPVLLARNIKSVIPI